jgi:hypothetical protein
VALRVEENLGMEYVLCTGLFQIGPGHLVEVLFGLEDPHPLIVEVEKILQFAEIVRRAQRLDRCIRQRDAIAFGKAEHGFGLDRPLDVQVQFGLWQPVDESGHDYLPTRLTVPRHCDDSGTVLSGLTSHSSGAGSAIWKGYAP